MDEFDLLDDMTWSEDGDAGCGDRDIRFDLDDWDYLTKTYDGDDFFEGTSMKNRQGEQEKQQQCLLLDGYQHASGGGTTAIPQLHEEIVRESPFLTPVTSSAFPVAVECVDEAAKARDCSRTANTAVQADMYEPSSTRKGHNECDDPWMSHHMNLSIFPDQLPAQKEWVPSSSEMVAMHPALQQDCTFLQDDIQCTFLQDDILEPSAAHAFSPPSPEGARPVPQICGDGSSPGDTAWPANSNPGIPTIAPLTAYNYFYRNERDTIVKGMTKAGDPLPPSDMDFTPRKMRELLHYHWTVDPYKKKRKHKKTHGVIDFATLARAISSRWKVLPERGREFYRDVAEIDQRRYEAYWAEFRSSSSLSTR